MEAELTREVVSPGGSETKRKERYTVEIDKPLLETVSFTIHILEKLRSNSSVITSKETITIAAGQRKASLDYSTASAYTNVGFFFADSGETKYTFSQKNNANGMNIAVYGSICPVGTSGSFNLGSSTNKWNTLYAKASEVDSSDANEKKDIMRLPDVYESVFDTLEPVIYKFREGDSGRTHSGLIAQQVKAALIKYGIDTKEFAAYCEWEKADGQIGCGLRYAEFIPLCIAEIQRLKRRISEMEKNSI